MNSIRSENEAEVKSSKCDDHDQITAKENYVLPNFNLPAELLVKIIDLVPQSQWACLEFVSRQFQDAVHELWKHLREIRLDELVYNEKKKRADPREIVESILEKFLIRVPKIAAIVGLEEFRNESKLFYFTIIHLLSKFQHLETIDLSGDRVVLARDFAFFLESSSSRQCWKSLNIDLFIFGNLDSHQGVDSENREVLNLECFKFNMNTLRIPGPASLLGLIWDLDLAWNPWNYHFMMIFLPEQWAIFSRICLVCVH